MGPAVGASGAVVAVFGAVAMLYPTAEVLLYFFIPMKIRTALYLFGAVEGLNLVTKAFGVVLPVIGGFASSSHLAGLLIGVWYGRKIKHRTNIGTLDLLGY
jgi:membrane associated rhomboid family serine protease